MNAEIIFSIANYIAMIGWLLLVLLPRWIGTRKIVMAGIIPILLAGVYLFLIVTHFGNTEGGFGSLEEVG
ncbi:MAG: abscisic acid-deficient protein Aba4 family protein, partial [Cyclobacteriaceae bacterium]